MLILDLDITGLAELAVPGVEVVSFACKVMVEGRRDGDMVQMDRGHAGLALLVVDEVLATECGDNQDDGILLFDSQ